MSRYGSSTYSTNRLKAQTQRSPTIKPMAAATPLARGLGWFSIGLGLAELLAPQQMARLTGVRNRELLQLYGLREIGTGLGILRSQQPTGWMWARVAGDLLDLTTLCAAHAEGDEEDQTAALGSTVAVAGVLLLDVISATQLSTMPEPGKLNWQVRAFRNY